MILRSRPCPPVFMTLTLMICVGGIAPANGQDASKPSGEKKNPPTDARADFANPVIARPAAAAPTATQTKRPIQANQDRGEDVIGLVKHINPYQDRDHWQDMVQRCSSGRLSTSELFRLRFPGYHQPAANLRHRPDSTATAAKPKTFARVQGVTQSWNQQRDFTQGQGNTDLYDPTSGGYYIGFRRPNGLKDYFNPYSRRWYFGVRNKGQGQDLYDPSRGKWIFSTGQRHAVRYFNPSSGRWIWPVITPVNK